MSNLAVVSNNQSTLTKHTVVINDTIRAQFKASSRTAIGRKKESAPLQVLIEKSLLSQGSTMHFGKGRAVLDSAALLKETGSCADYDYIHHPDIQVLGSSYTNVFASYVVNTLQYNARMYVYQNIAKCTKGIAFIAARSDTIKGIPNGDGFLTSINTFQKQYLPSELSMEAKGHFQHVVEIKGRSGMQIVACSHNPLPEHVLKHQKQ